MRGRREESVILLEMITDNECLTDFSSTHGGLSHASLVDNSSLLVLVGGGRVPRFAPNKVILWDEEAERLASIKQDDDTSSSSDGTASPLASTVFSVEREEREMKMEEAASQTLSQEPDDSIRLKDEQHAASSTSMSSSARLDDPFGAPPGVDRGREKEKEGTKAEDQTSSLGVDHSKRSDIVVTKGREVAELEFGEAVKGICVQTFEMPSTTTTTTATLLVVILNRRAVVFEMGSHIHFQEKEGSMDGEGPSSRWGIRQRLVVEIQPDLNNGLATLAPIHGSNCALLALPGRQTGHVQLISIALSKTARTLLRSSIAGASTIIAAHANPISSITLSNNGKLLCTTSNRGTLLRVWSTLSSTSSSSSSVERGVTSLTTTLVGELRRGSDSAKILAVTFSPDGQLLAAGSDKGTIHFFNMKPLNQLMSPSSFSSRSSPPANNPSPSSPTSRRTNSLSHRANKFLPPSLQQIAHSIPPSLVPQYLKSQWSFAQFKVPLKVFSSTNSMNEEYRRGSSPPIPPSSFYSNAREQADEEDPIMGSGKQTISLEGGWAGMRGRIDDVRRGEKGIEEGLWLDWIPISPPNDDNPILMTTSISKQGVKRPPTTGSGQTYPFELVAITNSGSHYRIALLDPNTQPSKQDDGNSPSSTVLNMYKEDSSTKAQTEERSKGDDAGIQCWLVDYQRFGMRDDWID